MPQTIPQGFGAQTACPTAEKLRAYGEGSLPFMPHEQVRLHLTTCDFCGAALQLLSRHTSAEQTHAPSSIPLHLRLLAQASLSGIPRGKRARQRSAA
jgi:hypothetical protein